MPLRVNAYLYWLRIEPFVRNISHAGSVNNVKKADYGIDIDPNLFIPGNTNIQNKRIKFDHNLQ